MYIHNQEKAKDNLEQFYRTSIENFKNKKKLLSLEGNTIYQDFEKKVTAYILASDWFYTSNWQLKPQKYSDGGGIKLDASFCLEMESPKDNYPVVWLIITNVSHVIQLHFATNESALDFINRKELNVSHGITSVWKKEELIQHLLSDIKKIKDVLQNNDAKLSQSHIGLLDGLNNTPKRFSDANYITAYENAARVSNSI